MLKKHIPNVVQINFKDALVQEIKDNFPDLLKEIHSMYYNSDEPVDYLFQTKPLLMRALMQSYGTDVRRKDNPNYWTDKWQKTAGHEMLFHKKNILTDDVRFMNEAQSVKEAGGVLVRLVRPDLPDNDMHISEQEQKKIKCDYVVEVGKGELDKLEYELIKILNNENNKLNKE